MSTGYNISGVDIDSVFESFSLSEQSSYGVTDSLFTNASNKFRKSGGGLKSALGKTIPTSSGNDYIGGDYSTSKYLVSGQPINVALAGMRPIGIPLGELTPGTYYINRVDGETWLSSAPNSKSGTHLAHNPLCIHIELQGGGGGGAGSTSFHASSGGGGGGYCYTAQQIPENSYLRIVVGSGGIGADPKGGDGSAGNATVLYNAGGTILCSANGGGGGIDNSGSTSGGTGNGGIINLSGGSGGKKENAGGSTPASTVTLNKPESTTWSRGGFSGGNSSGDNYGGGGGASYFSRGADMNVRSAGLNGTLGSGGSGGAYRVGGHSGGNGGAGVAKIYY